MFIHSYIGNISVVSNFGYCEYIAYSMSVLNPVSLWTWVYKPVHGKQNVGVGVKKYRALRMCLNSNDYLLLRTDRYGPAFMELHMGNTNQKTTRYTQKLKRKKHKYNPKKIINAHKGRD